MNYYRSFHTYTHQFCQHPLSIINTFLALNLTFYKLLQIIEQNKYIVFSTFSLLLLHHYHLVLVCTCYVGW